MITALLPYIGQANNISQIPALRSLINLNVIVIVIIVSYLVTKLVWFLLKTYDQNKGYYTLWSIQQISTSHFSL